MASKEKKPKSESENTGKSKFAALVTYIIALICLIAGLFVPLFNDNKILALQLPDAINKLTGKTIFSSIGKSFTLPYPVKIFGSETLAPDIMAIAVVVYAVITLLGIFALIPIIVSNRKKKTAYVLASIVEVIAALTLTVYMVVALKLFTEQSTMFSYNMVIALGGTVLMLIIQSFVYKGGKGVSKFFLFLFSVIGLLTLYSLTSLIPQVSTQIGELAKSFNFTTAFAEKEDELFTGIYYLDLLWTNLPETFKSLSAAEMVLRISGLGASIVVLLNLVSDLIGLASNAGRAGHVYNIVRYVLLAAFLICFIVTAIIGQYTLGLMLILLAVVTVIQIVMSAIRLVINKKQLSPQDKKDDNNDVKVLGPMPTAGKGKGKGKAGKNKEVAAVSEAEEDSEALIATPVANTPAAAPVSSLDEPAKEEDLISPAPEVQPIAEAPAQHTAEVPVAPASPAHSAYYGPKDSFLIQLNPDEMAQFNELFIDPEGKKKIPALANLPEYTVDGDNQKFFSTLFIYLGRVRPLVSDGLMNKMFKKINLM